MRRVIDSRAVKVSIGVLVAAACMWLIGRTVHLDSLRQALTNIDPRWVGAALFSFGVGYACRIERWRQMLEHENVRLTWIECAGPFFAGYAANNLLPLRAGDIVRAFAYTQTLGTTSGAVVASLFVERLLDLILVLALLGGALAFFGEVAPGLYTAGIVAMSVAAVSFVLAFLFPGILARVTLSLAHLIRRVWPNLGQRVVLETKNGLLALTVLMSGRSVGRLLLMSVTIWICEGCVFWFSALAMPALHFPSASWLALPAGTLGTLLPSTPGFVATFEYPVVLAMGALDNASSAAAAYAILVHAVLALPSVLIGGIYLLLHPSRSHRSAAEA